MAGYSGTPLVKKLGIKAGFQVALIGAPKGFNGELEGLPPVKLVTRLTKPIDFILFFTDSEKDLVKNFASLALKLLPNGMMWIAWPKRASGMATDLTDNVVRRIGLDAGLVDVKVCAVNDIWSGLKFVYRLKDR